MPIQPGDVRETNSDVTDLENDINYKPSKKVKIGIKNFVIWYTEFYNTTVLGKSYDI